MYYIVCGKNGCEGDENPDNCPEDCGHCGDYICSIPEAERSACFTDCFQVSRVIAT